MKFYIYKIINKLNGKCYVGKHKTFDGETFRAYMGSGIALVEAQRKYGIANFDKEIIEEIEDDKNELIVDERKGGGVILPPFCKDIFTTKQTAIY